MACKNKEHLLLESLQRWLTLFMNSKHVELFSRATSLETGISSHIE